MGANRKPPRNRSRRESRRRDGADGGGNHLYRTRFSPRSPERRSCGAAAHARQKRHTLPSFRGPSRRAPVARRSAVGVLVPSGSGRGRARPRRFATPRHRYLRHPGTGIRPLRPSSYVRRRAGREGLAPEAGASRAVRTPAPRGYVPIVGRSRGPDSRLVRAPLASRPGPGASARSSKTRRGRPLRRKPLMSVITRRSVCSIGAEARARAPPRTASAGNR